MEHCETHYQQVEKMEGNSDITKNRGSREKLTKVQDKNSPLKLPGDLQQH